MCRKEMKTEQAMEHINIVGASALEKFEEMLDRMTWDNSCEYPERLDYMQANIYGGRTLKSYDTIVAYFDGCNVYELGYYSRTTSKQVSRFAEKHGANVYRLVDSKQYLANNTNRACFW